MTGDIGTAFALVNAAYTTIQHVKLYRRQCEEMRGRCLNLLSTIQDGSRGLEGATIVGIIDELSIVIERIQAKINEWSTWSRLKCVVQQSDMKDGIDRLNRELDSCMMKFNIQSNIETHRNHSDLRSIQERDNSNIRELLLAIVKSQDDMRQLMNSQSSPVVEGVMENLQTQLMTAGLQPVEEKGLKAGLWQLHEQTSRLPPLTDLSGQITLLPSNPISGSSNEIYQGRWLDKQKVALRCPRALDDSPATRKRFEREVSFWRQLDHPNVVPLYGTVNIDEKLYSVTPWMDNGNASTYVARFPSVDRMKLLCETASGLEYLHEKQIIHGDLRGHNILVSEDGVACLSDFGLSKFFEDCDKKLIPSNNASIRWTAPEVIRNDGSVSTHSDVWSFGMVCFEILSGRFPFHGKDDKGVERQLDHGKHPDRPDFISNKTWDLMLKCWSKNPENRPPISAVKGYLEDIRTHSPVDPVDRHLDQNGLSYHPEPHSRKPTLKKISTFFSRKNDEDKGRASITGKPSSSSFSATTPLSREQALFERTNGSHDWRMDRTSSTHSHATTSSPINSYPRSIHQQSLRPSLNQPGFSPSSKLGSVNNLRDELQNSVPRASNASIRSRPSTANSISSLRPWPSPNLYEVPDEDLYSDTRDIPVHLGHQGTSYDYSNSMGGSSRHSIKLSVTETSRDIPDRWTKGYDHPNSSLGGASISSSMSPMLETPPSRSGSSHTSAELPLSGMGFLSSSPSQILGDNLRRSPTIQANRQRSATTGSSQPMEPQVFAIQNATETSRRILHSISGFVSSGTLEGLVQFLIDGFDSPRHTEYRDIFLMACAEVTTPDGLFQILSQRFVDEEKNENAENRVITQYNILMIISYWLRGDYLTPSQELFYRMKFFCEQIAKLKYAGTLLDRANDLYYIVVVEIDKLHTPPPTTLEPGGITLQSSQVTPRQLAIGLTLHEGDNYAALHPSDYIVHLSKRQSAKIKKLYDCNNKIIVWVTESILHFDDVHDRAEVLKFFTHTAAECLTMRNFASAAAIASALHSSAVDNLRVTRRSLVRNIQSKLSDLYDLINPESNHRGYREALHNLSSVQEKDTCVPWMAFHLKELGKVLRIYPVTIEEDGQHLINFNRYVKFMDRTREIMYYLPPQLEEFRHRGQLAYLVNQLRNVHPSEETDERLMTRSRLLMLQEASDYRTRKPQLVKLGFDF